MKDIICVLVFCAMAIFFGWVMAECALSAW
jgi:hypothetical protein